MSDNTPIKNPVQLTPALIEKIFVNQAEEINLKIKDIDLKKQELDFKKQEDDHSFEYAKDALKAKLEDNKNKRDYGNNKRKHRYFFICGIILIISIVVVIALCLGKDQVAMEIIKAVVFSGIGGAGGYYMGKAKGSIKTNENDDTDDPLV